MIQQKISVVTVCYNAVNDIEKTILSVINQTYPNVEYLIIDGGSTDGTMDVVNRYKDKIDIIVSEPDKGIYDAMNKGIDRATGEWINFMNAGDYLVDNFVLQSLSSIIDADTLKCDFYYGNSVQVFSKHMESKKPFGLKFLYQSMPFSHQCIFAKKEILLKHRFSLQYKLASDYELFLYNYIGKSSFKYVSLDIACIDLTKGATANNFRKSQNEAYLIRRSYGCNCFWNSLYKNKCMLRYFVSKILKS